MEVKVKLTGIAMEITGKEVMRINLNDRNDFNKSLEEAIPELKNYSYRVAVNGKLTDDMSSIDEEADVLIFSPIAGG